MRQNIFKVLAILSNNFQLNVTGCENVYSVNLNCIINNGYNVGHPLVDERRFHDGNSVSLNDQVKNMTVVK